MPDMYRLPCSNEETKSGKKYVSAWRQLAEPIAAATGSTLWCWDPDVGLVFENHPVYLPARFAKKLNELIESDKNEISRLKEHISFIKELAEIGSGVQEFSTIINIANDALSGK